MRVKRVSDEVFFGDDQIVKVGHRDIGFLKEKAECNRRKRIRLCAHKNVNDALHEMFIVHKKDAYIRPHKHPNKIESFHLIEGLVNVIVFDEAGNIIEIIRMGDYLSGSRFYYRISDPYYHTLLISSDFLVFHEVTNGPFKKSDTIFPPWAPDETDLDGVKGFMDRLSRTVDKILSDKQKYR